MVHDTRLIMGMPVTVEIVGSGHAGLLEAVFDWFGAVDRRFSTYKPESEISAINAGRLGTSAHSADMREVFALAEATRIETGGYFDIRRPDGSLDPSGIVKGWAIDRAARTIAGAGIADFYVEAGGDIQAGGRNPEGGPWTVGIRNPFCASEIIKVIAPGRHGVATSGSYVRGDHIYDPLDPAHRLDEIVSLTVIGPDICTADRFATAAFAMGRAGVHFIEDRPGLEAYAVDRTGRAVWTAGFRDFVIQ